MKITPATDGTHILVRCEADDPATVLMEALRFLQGMDSDSETLLGLAMPKADPLQAYAGSILPAVPQALGWEVLSTPASHANATLRPVRLPPGYRITPGVAEADDAQLVSIHEHSAWALEQDTLDRQGSCLVWLNDVTVGWVPVWRASPTLAVARWVLLRSDLFADSPTRRTHLRLTAFRVAGEWLTEQGISVVSWIPNDGDEVNEYKLAITQPAAITEWSVFWLTREQIAADY